MKAGIPKSLYIIETEFIDKNFLKNHLKVSTYWYKKKKPQNFFLVEKKPK